MQVSMTQLPAPQELVLALGKPVQVSLAPTFEQPPQLAVLRKLVSQPVASIPSQSSKPAAHVVISHVVPPAQLVVAVLASAVLQLLPHAPQFCTVVMSVSQPLR
jgi:hypothetical protein